MCTWDVLLQLTAYNGMLLAIFLWSTNSTGWLLVAALHIHLELINRFASEVEQEAAHFVAKLVTQKIVLEEIHVYMSYIHYF